MAEEKLPDGRQEIRPIEDSCRASEASGMKIDRIDHLVLTVLDIQRSAAFYADVLGMQPTAFGRGRCALVFGQQKLHLHPADAPVEPHARYPVPGSADLCFITSAPIAEVLDHLVRVGVPVEKGPVTRTGAMGEICSVYFRDPDGNLIEVSRYV